MKRLANFVIVIRALGMGLKLAVQGGITPDRAAVFLFLVVVAAALGKGVIKLILACASLAIFLLEYTNHDMGQFQQLAISVGALLLVLLGMYVMLGGMRKE